MKAIVVGAGFYGCSLAMWLKNNMRFEEVILMEREDCIMNRASANNQARLHSGAHYPRDLQTAVACQCNLKKFWAHYPTAVCSDFTSLYAVARGPASHRTVDEFEKAMDASSVPLLPMNKYMMPLFNEEKIAAIYQVVEPVLRLEMLRKIVASDLIANGVDVRTNTHVSHTWMDNGKPFVDIIGAGFMSADWLFVCTYAAYPQPSAVKMHMAEVCLIHPPFELRHLGITVVDGPFFSTLPFPDMDGLHSLTHVRHTQHLPLDLAPNFQKMRAEASKYVPCMANATYESSIFEVKALPEEDPSFGYTASRPIVVQQEERILSITGSKIGNVYDMYPVVEKAICRTES